MKSRYLLGAGAALAVALGSVGANAQFAGLGGPYPITYYVGPEGGWTSLQNQKTSISTVPFRVDTVGGSSPGPFFSNFTGSARYNSGFNAGARLGLQYGPLRVEEEYSYRHNGLSSFQSFFSGIGANVTSGNRNTNSIMTNFIYDFTLGWPVSPHIGFGVGAVDNVDSISLNGVTLNGGPFTVSGPGGVLGRIGTGTPFPNPTIGGTFLKGNSWNFGYQAIAGF